jgi:hypothetical protein
MSAFDLAPSFVSGSTYSLAHSSFLQESREGFVITPTPECSGNPLHIPTEGGDSDLMWENVNGKSAKSLLNKVEAQLQKTGKALYAEACILQLSLLVRIAGDPYAFGIMGHCSNDIIEGFERYRAATVGVLLQLASAQGVTCDQVFDVIAALEKLKRSSQSPHSRTIAEEVELRVPQEDVASHFLTADSSVPLSSVQSGGQSSLSNTLSQRFQQTYEPYRKTWLGEHPDASNQQESGSIVSHDRSWEGGLLGSGLI